MRKWRSGSASPCQGEGREFESRLPLQGSLRCFPFSLPVMYRRRCALLAQTFPFIIDVMKGRTRDDIDEAREAIIEQLKAGIPKSEICARFKCKPDTLNRRLKAWGVNHLNNQPGRNRPKYAARKSVLECLTENSTAQTYRLKLWLWRDGLKPQHCEECGWARRANDGRLPLELHHINGDTYDNRLGNLLVLCPNCHSLKNNHRGLSKGKMRRQLQKINF
jgi:hypothetical protein